MARWGEDAEDRLQRAVDGSEARHLKVRDLEPGRFGILEVTVRSVAPEHTFMRKNGTEGRLCRVTVADETGEVDMVLWGAEIQATTGDGPLRPGNRIILRGATVKDGFRGGVELGWTGCEAEVAPTGTLLEGTLCQIAATEPVATADGIHFKAEAKLETEHGECTVTCWGAAVKDLQGRIGEHVTLHARPHPVLDDHFIVGSPPST